MSGIRLYINGIPALLQKEDTMNNLSDEILKTIKYAIERKKIYCDRTYKSVIKSINKKGYVVLDDSGGERTVQCRIPNIELNPGQGVWVTEPMGRLNDLHISGVVNKTSKG